MIIKNLHLLVDKQYSQKLPTRDSWSDWLYERHVPWVAERTRTLCEQYGGDPEIAVAAALVHDIADSVISRFDTGHENESLIIGRRLCKEAGYSADQISIIIDDICQKHSCRNGVEPQSLEGKIMATADACFHFETDFYFHAFYHTDKNQISYEERMRWMRDKLEKDFNKKIFFDETRETIRPYYSALKALV